VRRKYLFFTATSHTEGPRGNTIMAFVLHFMNILEVWVT